MNEEGCFTPARVTGRGGQESRREWYTHTDGKVTSLKIVAGEWGNRVERRKIIARAIKREY